MEGVHGTLNALDLERAGLLYLYIARFQLINGVLRWKLRWLFVFMVFFHCPWV